MAPAALSTVTVLTSPTGRRVDGESAGITKQVQHPQTARPPPHPLAVVTLVQEQSALLSVDQIHSEAQTVFSHLDLVVGDLPDQGGAAGVRLFFDADPGPWRWPARAGAAPSR